MWADSLLPGTPGGLALVVRRQPAWWIAAAVLGAAYILVLGPGVKLGRELCARSISAERSASRASNTEGLTTTINARVHAARAPKEERLSSCCFSVAVLNPYAARSPERTPSSGTVRSSPGSVSAVRDSGSCVHRAIGKRHRYQRLRVLLFRLQVQGSEVNRALPGKGAYINKMTAIGKKRRVRHSPLTVPRERRNRNRHTARFGHPHHLRPGTE